MNQMNIFKKLKILKVMNIFIISSIYFLIDLNKFSKNQDLTLIMMKNYKLYIFLSNAIDI